MGLFSILKRNSKLAIRGSWGRAIIILLIVAGASTMISALTQIAVEIFTEPMPAASAAPAFDVNDIAGQLAAEFRMSTAEWIIAGVSAILSVMLISPLVLGELRWYYNLVHSKSTPITELFYFFESGKSYFRAIGYEINLTIRALLWMILFYGPPSAVFGVAMFFLSGNEELSRTVKVVVTSGIFISAVLYIIATFFYAACICRYALTPYLIAENPDLTVGKAIKLSVKYTKGYRFSILWFGASYIGWFLLSILVFPLFYVIPYYQTGIAMYARFIIEKNRNAVPPPTATREFAADTGGLEPGTGTWHIDATVETEPQESTAGDGISPTDNAAIYTIEPDDDITEVQIDVQDANENDNDNDNETDKKSED